MCKKLKRTICMIISVLILVTAPLMSYMDVQATEVIVTTGLLDYLLGLFGISAGLGAQTDFWSQTDFDYIADGIANGNVVSIGDYGDVDFSDSLSIQRWLNYSLSINSALLGNGQLSAGSLRVAKALDNVSYNNTGTSASNAMYDYISAFYDDYNGSSEALAEDIRDCFTVINGGGNFNDDNDDDEKKAERRKKFWRTFAAVTSAGLFSGNVALPLAALKEYGNDSEFNDYDAAFRENGYSDSYLISSDGRYNYYYRFNYTDSYGTVPDYYDGYFPYNKKLAGVFSYDSSAGCNKMYIYSFSDGYPLYSQQLSTYIYENNGVLRSENLAGASSVFYCVSYSVNFPVFSSYESAENFALTGDTSGVLNLSDPESYHDFKSNTGTADSVIGTDLTNLIATLSSLSALSGIIPSLIKAFDDNAGTSNVLNAVSSVLSDAVPDQDQNVSVDNSDYSGVLGRILTAINAIPNKVVNAFSSKFMTAGKLTQLLNSLPELFAAALDVTLTQPVINAVSAVPELMAVKLIEIFPDADAVGNAIIGLPDVIVEALEGIVINVPDIEIPEIVIPEIVIPEIAVPDVSVTLNPSYEITVENDFTGLDNIISGAVEDVLVGLFVPNAALTQERVLAITAYFEFKDDIIGAVYDLKAFIFGIEPSPILKIPIGKPSSKKYNYGFGNYIIIDISWYSTYKQFGDKVILAIAWALFLWRLFLKLPGIISGAEGSIVAADKAHDRYDYWQKWEKK